MSRSLHFRKSSKTPWSFRWSSVQHCPEYISAREVPCKKWVNHQQFAFVSLVQLILSQRPKIYVMGDCVAPLNLLNVYVKSSNSDVHTWFLVRLVVDVRKREVRYGYRTFPARLAKRVCLVPALHITAHDLPQGSVSRLSVISSMHAAAVPKMLELTGPSSFSLNSPPLQPYYHPLSHSLSLKTLEDVL